MIIEKLKKGENINQVLKRFKRKWRDRKIVQELRERQAFIKPSVKKRKQKQKAIYLQEKYNRENI
tara:strand:+ start:111 stop:305 length:195 start_codon:yes stop_codon:yes gene_type:complete